MKLWRPKKETKKKNNSEHNLIPNEETASDMGPDYFDQIPDPLSDKPTWKCCISFPGHGPEPNYKYNEGQLLEELKTYVISTYGEHYAKSPIQAGEFIIALGYGLNYCLCNIIKYASRYGKKPETNRKDILKILHYGLMALYVHDKETACQTSEYNPPREFDKKQSGVYDNDVLHRRHYDD